MVRPTDCRGAALVQKFEICRMFGDASESLVSPIQAVIAVVVETSKWAVTK
jgi:hypothetical protein